MMDTISRTIPATIRKGATYMRLKLKIDSKKKAVIYAIVAGLLFLFSLTKMITNNYSEFIYFNF